MYPSDEDPTTSLNLPPTAATIHWPEPPPSQRTLGHTGRIAAIGIAATVLIAAGAGIGLTFAQGGDDTVAPHIRQASRQGENPAATSAGDASRQVWAHQYGQDRATMPNLPDVASATPEQQAAAADLLARTESATAGYADVNAAAAAGFDLQASLARAEQTHPRLTQWMHAIDADQMPAQMAGRMPMLHVGNKANRRDGKVLDPSAPEALMYEYQGHDTWRLVGVMYTANDAYPQAPPDPGGPITRWHYHDKHGGAALMMHVFFVPGNDLAHAYALSIGGT